MTRSLVHDDPWRALRGMSPARIALGRAGGSVPTARWLEFREAHAAARDAVHNEFHAAAMAAEVEALGVPCVVVATRAHDRWSYLQRPDWGRQLAEPSRDALVQLAPTTPAVDLSIVVSDGLSALATHRQAGAVLAELLSRLTAHGWQLAPVVVAKFGRVGLQDALGELWQARLSLILLGERPGLGSPDSLGAYLVHGPRVGNTDAQRNCVSNIRPEGLPPQAAADTIFYLLNAARQLGISGTALKDDRQLPGPALGSK